MATAIATPPTPASVGGTITIPKGCKPSKACSTDYTRQRLLHAAVRRHGGALWLLMTDSYVAVALKVEGDANEGIVPIGALRLMEQGKSAVQVSATAWCVATPDGNVTFDCGDVGDFPDFASLGVWDKPEITNLGEVGMNPALMAKIGAALGAKHGCRMQFVGPLRPIYVTPLQIDTGVALQMPIRLSP